MSPEEIKILLKRKKKECLEDAKKALNKHDHNSESNHSYYSGKASGIDEALQVIGMLNKQNRININKE